MGKFDKLKVENRQITNEIIREANHFQEVSAEYDRVAEIYENPTQLLDEIDKDFCQKTKLDKVDVTFLMLATALQVARWVIIAQINQEIDKKLDASDKENTARKKDNDPSIEKKKHDQQTNYKKKHKWKEKQSEKFPTWKQIVTDGVPYDVTTGSPKFGVNMGAGDHRVHTLGHDPALGWIFGTMNIISSTISTETFRTFKVEKKPSPKHWAYETNIAHGFEMMFESIKEDHKRLPAAIFAQAVHLGSDYFTYKGLPVPFLEAFDPELASKLYKEGYDTLCLLKDVAVIGTQAGIAILINILISLVHGLFYDKKKYCSRDLYEDKTRKILSISNLIATSSNLIWVGGNMVAGNEAAIKDLDVGGLLVTIHRLITDYKFIKEIQLEFIEKQWYEQIIGEEYNFMKEIM